MPICDPKHLGMEEDGRMSFFSTVTTHTNGYAIMEKGFGGGYGYDFKLVTEQYLVRLVCQFGTGQETIAPVAYTGTGCSKMPTMTMSLQVT